MPIQEVLASHSPNSGRLIWNANDRILEESLKAFALNVKAAPYNAVGDGSADDLSAIQAAINDAYSAGGGYVFMPAGTFRLGTGSLQLRDEVNLIGAGMYSTTIKLGDAVNKPVITDEAAGVPGAYSSAKVHLANFSVDGNKAKNPRGNEGIFTTAYYSTFENLYILNCQTHGLRFGFAEMANAASQNRVVGCRIADCNETGIYLDINAVDHTITENYIHGCRYGVVMNNGGIRLINNAIFGHTCAIQVKQTSYGTIIANNDLNYNKQHGIHVTRTTVSTTGPWSQILISGNSILGDALESDNLYDGIYVETGVPDGIAKLTIVGNKIFALNDANQYRYGINLDSNITKAKCAGNHINNFATARYHVGPTCSGIEIDSIGGGVLGPPSIPSSGKALTNPYHVPVTVHITGGNVTAIAISGTATGLRSGSFRLLAGQPIAITYRSAPTWTWFAD